MNEFPRRLYHNTPGWVKDSALFHVRIRVDVAQRSSLVEPSLAQDLLAAARRYHESAKWWCELFVLMPDHLHAVLAFPRETGMAATIRNWKRGTARYQGVLWQENFFDHRLRSEKDRAETWHYIRRNPVAKGLCVDEDSWPWWWSGAVEKSGTRQTGDTGCGMRGIRDAAGGMR